MNPPKFSGNVCEDNACAFTKECANHHSAGDFRCEDGARPNIKLGVNNTLTCDRTITDGIGAIFIKNGKLWTYNGPYENQSYELPRPNHDPANCVFCIDRQNCKG